MAKSRGRKSNAAGFRLAPTAISTARHCASVFNNRWRLALSALLAARPVRHQIKGVDGAEPSGEVPAGVRTVSRRVRLRGCGQRSVSALGRGASSTPHAGGTGGTVAIPRAATIDIDIAESHIVKHASAIGGV